MIPPARPGDAFLAFRLRRGIITRTAGAEIAKWTKPVKEHNIVFVP